MYKKGILLVFLTSIILYLIYFKFGSVHTLVAEIGTPLLNEANLENPNTKNKSNNIKKPKDIGLEDDVIEIIEKLIKDVDVKSEENNIGYAVKLDHEEGRPLWFDRKYKAAYKIYKKVLKISYNVGSLQGIHIALSALSDIQKNMGQTEEALDVLLLAYKVALKQNNRKEYGVLEMSIARQLESNERGLALMWRLKSKESLEGTNYLQDTIQLKNQLADDLVFFNKKNEALIMHQQAYELSDQVGNEDNLQWIIKSAHYNYAKALTYQDNCDEASSVINKHFNKYSSEKDKTKWYYRSMLYLRGVCQEKLGQNDAAFDSYMQAFTIYEQQRALAATDEARSKLDKSNYNLVNNLVESYINAGNLKQALLILETSKAKTLNDIYDDSVQKQIYQEWKDLKLSYLEKKSALFEYQDNLLERKSNKDKIIEFYELAEKYAEDELDLKLSQEFKQRTIGENMLPSQIEEIIAGLPTNTALLSVFIAEDMIGVFTITNKGISYYPSNYTKEKLKLRTKEIKYMIGNPHVDFYQLPAQEIYEGIFAAAINGLDKKYNRLIMSLDDYLINLPPAILYDGKHHLAEKYIIQQYPSFRFFSPKSLGNHSPPVNGISCADPEIQGYRLPFQRDISNVIQASFKNKIYDLKGKDCNVSRINQALAKIDNNSFLHIGAYGRFLSYSPMQSGVYLYSNNEQSYEFWNAMDMGITNMKNINLLSLSNCDTGKIDEDRARDVFGIKRGLFFAGVENILAPLWPTQDKATSTLMQYFYKNYFSNGDPAKALHKAQKHLMFLNKYNHPYYWGAFIVAGGAR